MKVKVINKPGHKKTLQIGRDQFKLETIIDLIVLDDEIKEGIYEVKLVKTKE